MSEGIAIAQCYTVCYKFLIPETKSYFPSFNDLEEEKSFFAG